MRLSLSPALEGQLAELRRQLQTNRRLRWALYAAYALAMAFAVDRLTIWLDDARSAYRELAVRYSKTQRAAEQQQWIQRAEAVRQRVARMEKRLWQADSPGLLQANVQSWVEEGLARDGMGDVRVNVTRPVSAMEADGVLQVDVQLQGPLSPGALRSFVHRVEQSERAHRIQRLDVFNGRRPHFVLTVRAFGATAGMEDTAGPDGGGQ
jgi:hypothetical protein